MRVHIASEDIAKVQNNIKNNKINVIANIEDENLKHLMIYINNAGNAIIEANSDHAPTYPTATYMGHHINGLTMCRLVAVKIIIAVIKSILVNGRDIVIALHKKDSDYCKKNNLDELSVLGYIAINGELPKGDNLVSYSKNKNYYESMGILLNSKERNKSSWMKSLYRCYRHSILKCLMNDLKERGILSTEQANNLVSTLELVRDSSTVYNLNQYIYYLCEIVGVVDVSEKNLYLTLLSDNDGYRFVREYELTKYYTWRKSCQNQINNTSNTFEKLLPLKMGLLTSQMTSTLGCYQRV